MYGIYLVEVWQVLLNSAAYESWTLEDFSNNVTPDQDILSSVC